MSDLRERFRALDSLDVPDVMTRARRIGPKAPEPEPPSPRRKAAALAFAAVVAIVAAVLIVRALEAPVREPATPPEEPRGSGEVITYTEDPFTGGGDLVARDPDTGEERVLVEAGDPEGHIGTAAWSFDRELVAFEILGCSSPRNPNAGLWVTDGVDPPRRLTTKECFPDSDVEPMWELWAWSPTGSQIAVASRTAEEDTLVLIDAVTGRETEIGRAVGVVASLDWSFDGTTMSYNSSPNDSIYAVRVEDGARTLLAERLGFVHGDIGDGIHWSGDGSRIAIELQDDPVDLYLVNADGSDLRLIERHVAGGTWSPDGRRLAYATFAGRGGDGTARIWTISVEDETPLLVLESASSRAWEGLAWSPDGTRIAFDTDGGDGTDALVTNADGSGDTHMIDDLVRESWLGGDYACGCYG